METFLKSLLSKNFGGDSVMVFDVEEFCKGVFIFGFRGQSMVAEEGNANRLRNFLLSKRYISSPCCLSDPGRIGVACCPSDTGRIGM